MFDLENNSINVSRIALRFESFSRKLWTSNNIKLCLTHNGEGIWQISNKLYSVKKGDIVVLNNHRKRVFREVSLLDGIELITIDFNPQLLFNTPFVNLFYNDGIRVDCKLAGTPKIQKLFLEMESESKNRLSYYDLVLHAKLIELLSMLSRSNRAFDAYDLHTDSDMCNVLEFINENYTRDIKLEDASRLFHMSTTSFSKYFSRHFKMGFAQYIMHKRINYAIHLLGKTNKTVLNIALECGFNSSASFYKAFKKVTSKTPMQYRSNKML